MSAKPRSNIHPHSPSPSPSRIHQLHPRSPQSIGPSLNFTLTLSKVTVENFKSFDGHHEICPLAQFTGIVGPNGSGKSNIIDAVSFGLMLKPLTQKHRHLAELVYRQEGELHKVNPRDMSVRLEFEGAGEPLSLMRIYHPTKVCEYFVNDVPLTMEEYAQRLAQLNLLGHHFCAQQGRLEEMCFRDGKALGAVVEEMSGSVFFKREYEDLKEKINECDKLIKASSEQLQSLRMEKVKMKGLQEYVDQMKDCLRSQKQVEQQAVLAEILLCEKEVIACQESICEYERGIEDTQGERAGILKELKGIEGELRKLLNAEEGLGERQKARREQLMGLKMDVVANQKSVELCRQLLQQKKTMLQRMDSDWKAMELRKQQYATEIQKYQAEIQVLTLQMQGNQDLQAQEQVRDEYLQIFSKIEVENAQIGRQISMLDQGLGALVQRKAKVEGQLGQAEAQLRKETSSENLDRSVGELKEELKEKERVLQNYKQIYEQTKDRVQKRKAQIHQVEKSLLEKEFELKEVEHEKSIKNQEAKTSQTLEELKKRCKGYLGQLYELIKPINSQFDIPVKVALGKCLRFLVVDNASSAEYCTEFLKEKGLYKDLLVLENVPEKQVDFGLKKVLAGRGNLVYEVVEVSRKHPSLERAVRYFLGEKVVCRDFDTGVQLQAGGARYVVTEEGTEFKAGMISGGQHQNIFNLSLGTSKLDKQWSNLLSQVQQLDQELQVLKEQEREDASELEQRRGLTKIEGEIESAKAKISESERMLHDARQRSKELHQTVEQLKKEKADVVKKIEDLLKQKKGLSDEIREIEEVQFKDFLAKHGFPTLSAYEESWSRGSAKDVSDRRQYLEQQISKMEKELKQIEESGALQSIQTLEQSVRAEEEKLQALARGEKQSEVVEGLQEELKAGELEAMTLKKQKDEVLAKQAGGRQKSENLANRIESLEKELNMLKLQSKNWYLKKQSQIEAAQLALIIGNFREQPVKEEQDEMQIETGEKQASDVDYSKLPLENYKSASKEEVVELIQSLKERLRELNKKEEEYNQNAAMVPESDPNVTVLNDQIVSVKEQVDAVGKEKMKLTEKFKEVSERRSEIFLAFFDELQKHLQIIYKQLTERDGNQGGTVQIFIDDRVMPFEKDIHYFPAPPGKRAVYDIGQLSGGEKTLAALAMLFALAKVKRPHLILLDEVDTFLDAKNVKLVADYVKTHLKSQILLVSHKEQVVANANSLIGMVFQEELNTSRFFTLNLDEYPEAVDESNNHPLIDGLAL